MNGRLAAWCAQHDEHTLAPAPARKFEPVSLSGGESVGVVRFLMSLDEPSPEVIAAVEQAKALPPNEVLQHRIGIHLGDVVQRGSDLLWFDLDQSVLMHYANSYVHHDIDQLADGRFAFIAYDLFEDPPGTPILGSPPTPIPQVKE